MWSCVLLFGGGVVVGVGGEVGMVFCFGVGGGLSFGMDYSGLCGVVGGCFWSVWRLSGCGGEGI